MQYIEVKGYKVPALGLGTWRLREDVCRQIVERALALGYRAIDTAQAYDNEFDIGQVLAASGIPRKDLFLTTKIWPDVLDRDEGAIDASLADLRTDYADLLLLHWPNRDRPLGDSLAPLVRALESGKARMIGVSNFPSALLREAVSIAPIACNQVEYHPYLSQAAVLDIVREHELLLTAYCPLARGEFARDPAIDAIAQAHKKTKAQVTLRWLLQQERVAAIPRTARLEHLAENFDVFDFTLTDAEMQSMNGLAYGKRLVDPEFAPSWD
ncbi:MAG TPA: aldo/keto reductase [Haliangium sp.]|nr:aldo/keto reductase [Haliangium sp.]